VPKNSLATNIDACYSAKPKQRHEKGFRSFNENTISDSGSDSENGNPTIRDDVSWAELAFGQSMRSPSISHMTNSIRQLQQDKPIKK